MRAKPQSVFDVSAVVSAALFVDSTLGKALNAARRQGTLLASQATITELTEVLSRAKFDRYAHLHDRLAFAAQFAMDAELVEPTERIEACRDPKDDKFLELAVAAQADVLVTGDADLLVLHPFRGIAILTPAAFLAALGAAETPSA